jgi:hypothetical protein
MREETTASTRDGYWTSHPSSEQVKRLESACHRVALPAGSGEALIAILDEEHPDPLLLRVAAARLCHTRRTSGGT